MDMFHPPLRIPVETPLRIPVETAALAVGSEARACPGVRRAGGA
jgi:hypothetical protein